MKNKINEFFKKKLNQTNFKFYHKMGNLIFFRYIYINFYLKKIIFYNYILKVKFMNKTDKLKK